MSAEERPGRGDPGHDAGAPVLSAGLVGIDFRPMGSEDIEGGLRLCRLSRWDQTARDWARFLHTDPSGSTVAVRDGRIVGSAATVRYGARLGWIGMVLVDPEVRGLGLGTRLLSRALRQLEDVPVVGLDATPAGHAIYVKHGFVEAYRLRRMEAVARRDRILSHPDIRAMIAADLPAVAAWDAQVFGAPREAMLDWMHAGARDGACVALRDRRLAGYLFERAGRRFVHLGPIVAADPYLACAMMARALARHEGREVVVDTACRWPAWRRFLEYAGFQEQRPFIRMYRGGGLPFGQPHRQYAVLGPEFG